MIPSTEYINCPVHLACYTVEDEEVVTIYNADNQPGVMSFLSLYGITEQMLTDRDFISSMPATFGTMHNQLLVEILPVIACDTIYGAGGEDIVRVDVEFLQECIDFGPSYHAASA